MIFVFLHVVGKIWWFLSFCMMLEKFNDFYLYSWIWKILMICVFYHEVGKIWWFVSFIMKLEKFDDFRLFSWSRKNFLFFVFFLQVGKIWWFLSFIMKLEKFDDWYLLTWQRDGMCHHRTELIHLPVTFPPCLDIVLLLIMIIPSAHLYRDDLELPSFNLKFPEKEWYVEKKKESENFRRPYCFYCSSLLMR